MAFEPLTPERRRAMTRQHLLEAAAIVFAREGFHGSTLDEVATTAGFTKGAVYSNFKSKEDLFLELIDYRFEREFAVTAEVLASGPHDAADQMPRIRELLRGASFLWDDTFNTLYLEFLLYAKRNPEVGEKLAVRAERSRALIQELIEDEHRAVGETPKYPTRDLAEIFSALFSGLAMDRLANPGLVTAQTVDTALSFLYDAMGVVETTRQAEPAHRPSSGD